MGLLEDMAQTTDREIAKMKLKTEQAIAKQKQNPPAK